MLIKRAFFNSIALMLDQLAMMVLSFVLTPILISSLGMTVYGIWQLILRGSMYISFLDGRGQETLKWQIARSAAETKKHEFRQLFGASLLVWLAYFPVVLIGSAIFIYWISTVDELGSPKPSVLYCAALLMVFNAVFISLRNFPESILRGSNKGYKQIGIRLVFLGISGFFSIYAIKRGYGIVGLSIVQLFTSIFLGMAFLKITERQISWFGIDRPTRNQFLNSYRLSFWYFLWSIINFGFISLDVILLGLLASTIDITRYVVTFFAVKMITGSISTVLTAILPGIGVLIGQNKKERACIIRKESVLYSWWLAISIGSTILLVNSSFVNLWVGDDVYAGSIENLLIILMALQFTFIKNDSLIINLALEQKEKVKVTLISLSVTVFLSILLVPEYEIAGLCIALIVGRFILNYYYPRIIGEFFETKNEGVIKIISSKGWLMAIIILTSAFIISRNSMFDNWPLLILVSLVSFPISLVSLYLIGFNSSQKRCFINRLATFKNQYSRFR